jgi:predicted transcriptional regulator of viral defense system
MKNIIDKIIGSKKTVFSVSVLAKYLEEDDDISLRKKISYYTKTGYLERLSRGIYTVKGMTVNLKELANMVYSPSYVSFETALYHHGIIFQANPSQVDLAYKKSDEKQVGSVDLLIKLRALKQEILLNPEGIKSEKNYSIASAERVFLDMIYINKDYYFDNLE